MSELLALTWKDVCFDTGFVQVRRQLNRQHQIVSLKTASAVRDVVLMPTLRSRLLEHRLASSYSTPDDSVFSSRIGTAMSGRNVRERGFNVAAERAGLNSAHASGFTLHDCRHTFASLLIADGANIVFVSRQMGHASPSIMLDRYGDLFGAVEQADRMSALLEARHGHSL
jgi:integrase